MISCKIKIQAHSSSFLVWKWLGDPKASPYVKGNTLQSFLSLLIYQPTNQQPLSWSTLKNWSKMMVSPLKILLPIGALLDHCSVLLTIDQTFAMQSLISTNFFLNPCSLIIMLQYRSSSILDPWPRTILSFYL